MSAVTKRRNPSHQRRAAIVPIFAVMLFALLAVGGLAIDYAFIQQTAIELRTASDAVARSAATELSVSDSQDQARERALEVAKLYRVGNKAFELQASDVQFGRVTLTDTGTTFTLNEQPVNAARVDCRRADNSIAGGLQLFFGPIFGTNKAQIGVTSTASLRMVDICLVLDRSSSMKLPTESNLPGLGGALWTARGPIPPVADSRWLALDKALRDFITLLDDNRTEERVGVVTFASNYSAFGVDSKESSIDCDITGNLRAVENTVNMLSTSVWNGNTYIESGMRKGIELFETSSQVRRNAEKIMIVLTDGFQTNGECRNAARDCAAKNIKVNSITVGNFADQVLMQEVATIGNGSYAHASNEEALRAIFRQLAAESTMLVQ